jgi:hypothetical protein
MKYLTHLILASITINYACAQFALVGHEWNVTLKVVDETGKPIEGAKASVGYYSKSQPKSIDGLTDTNGIFKASHRAYSGILGFTAEKSGFYTTREPSYELGFTYDYTKWNPTRTIILKRISKPSPMYAKRIESGPPGNGAPIGYDLMIGDWVGPCGKGISTDIIFTREYNKRTLQDYDYKLTVSFPKAGDGIQEFPVSYKNMEGSGLRSPHEALTNGYQSQIVRLNVSHPGQKLIFDYDENRVYLFRVRTTIDDRGNILSAQYGKIYGDFMQFSYYLNPTPNDRNVEFDPKHNLIKHLNEFEDVSQP